MTEINKDKLREILDDDNKEIEGEILTDQHKDATRISTGIYALNKIISGSLFEGIPSDKSVGIYGASDSGKCATSDMVITLRDRETGEVFEITLGEFFELID